MTIAPAKRRQLTSSRSVAALRWAAFARNPLSVTGAAIIIVVFFGGTAAPLIAPYAPNAIALDQSMQPPGVAHLFGTDQFGRDIFSRVLFGARVSLLVGVAATVVAFALGVAGGALAAFYGKWTDEIVMRVVDIIVAFPFIVLAVAIIVVSGTSLWSLIVAIGIVRMGQFARVTRSSVLAVQEQDYVLAARACGQRPLLILTRHIMPNAVTPLIVLASLSVATAINAEAALSFLGVGIQPPDASWGTLVADGRTYLLSAPWMATLPGLAISFTILGYNLMGDGLRDALDPRSQSSTA